jgi:hypothetical protein
MLRSGVSRRCDRTADARRDRHGRRIAREQDATLCHLASSPLMVLLALCASITAHEFTLDAVMNAFLRVDANEARLVIRAPLFLFKNIKFPVKGAEIDAGNAAPAMQRALAALQENLSVLPTGAG